MRLFLRVLFAFFVLAPGTALAQDPKVYGVQELEQLNVTFRSYYAIARAAELRRTGPILVVAFEELVLIDHGERKKAENFTPPIYHQLKAIAHVPLSIYLFSAARGPVPLNEGDMGELRRFRTQVAEGRRAMAALDLSPSTRAVHERILDRSLAALDSAIAAGRLDPAAIRAFCAASRPDIDASVREAARAQLDGLHALAARWRTEMGDAAWKTMPVIVQGIRQARPDNLQFGYFQRALGGDAEPLRLVYAESIFEEPAATRLMGTILLDRGMSDAFFGDSLRLERDLMGDAAHEWLAATFGKN